jgi:hypothetical protein
MSRVLQNDEDRTRIDVLRSPRATVTLLDGMKTTSSEAGGTKRIFFMYIE